MNLNLPATIYEIKSHHVTLTLTPDMKEAEDTYKTSPAIPKFKQAFALNTATGKKSLITFAEVVKPAVKSPK